MFCFSLPLKNINNVQSSTYDPVVKKKATFVFIEKRIKYNISSKIKVEA